VAWLALIVGLAVVGVIVGIAVLAKQSKDSFESAGQLIPGVPSPAPTSWAGSHDPEARLHRRLRDALAALRANQVFDQSGALLDLRVELEQQALAVDEQLVATAALPLSLRGESLDRLTEAVNSIEQAVAELAGQSASVVAQRLEAVLDDVRSRVSTVAQARAALDELDAEHGLYQPGGLSGATGDVSPTTHPGEGEPGEAGSPQPGS
jgi:hypothetical protein